MSTTIVRAACPRDCPDTCALPVTVKDGVADEATSQCLTDMGRGPVFHGLPMQAEKAEA